MRVKRLPEYPPRPFIPPLFWCALGSIVISMTMLENTWERAGAGRWCGFSFILPVVVSLVCIACLVCTRVMRHCKAASLLKALHLACLCLIALVWSVCLWSNGMATQIEEVKGTASSYVFEVIGDSNPGEHGFSYTAVAKRKDGSGTTFRVRATGEKGQMRGDRFCAVGNFAALGDSDWARSRFFKGEVARLSLRTCYPAEHEVSNDVVQRVRRFLLNRLNPDSTEEGSLITGVLCGYTTELNRGSIREDFAACGLSHLIAVSGSHLAIVACLVQNVLWQCGLDSRKSRVLMLGACCFYTLLTGAAPSTIRSACMVGCTNVSMGSGRRSHALSSLSLTLIVMLVIWPNLVFDLGFQLSALSVASILIFGRYVSYALHVLRLPSFIAEGMGITLTAQIATLPLTTSVFGQISLLAPVANVIIAPLISILLVLGVVAATVLWIPGISAFMALLLHLCSRVILFFC